MRLHGMELGIAEVSAGPFHTTCLTHSGSVFGFGDGAMGQLGLLELNGQNKSPLPRCLPGLNHIVVRSLSCGAYHTALLTNTGAFTFGSRKRASWESAVCHLVCQKITRTTKDIIVMLVEEIRQRQSNSTVLLWIDFTILLSCDGTVLCFGNGDSGQLGLGHNARENQPRSVLPKTCLIAKPCQFHWLQ